MLSGRFTVTAVLLLALLCSCGGREESGNLSSDDMAVLQEVAGTLARHWCLPEESAGWREAPSDSLLAIVERICSGNDGGWTYFYMRMSDSANVLEPPPFQDESADPGEDSVYVAEDDQRE